MLIAVVLALTSCSGNSFKQIKNEDIVEVSVWANLPENDWSTFTKELTDDELSNFILLYNKSQYNGKSSGEGGTPDFGAIIKFKNGDSYSLNQFAGKSDFEVVMKNHQSFYLNNSDMFDYLNEISSEFQ